MHAKKVTKFSRVSPASVGPFLQPKSALMPKTRSTLRGFLVLLVCWCGLPAAESQAVVLFDFMMTDGSDVPGSGGFFDPMTPDGAANAAALADAADVYSSLLDHSAVIDIAVTTYSDPGDSTIATAGGFFYIDPLATGVVANAVQEEILFGGSSGLPHGFIILNTAKSYYNGFDPSMIGPDENDLRSVFIHELTHTLGWSSAVKADGTSGLTDAFVDSDPVTFAGLDELFTIYDTLLVDTADTKLIDPMTGDFDVSTLPLSGVLIGSPEAEAAFGGSIPTIVTPFGLDATHLPFGPFDTIMNPGLPDGEIKRVPTPIDIGVLKDLGYSFVAIPEPGSVALLMLTTPLAMLRRRSRL